MSWSVTVYELNDACLRALHVAWFTKAETDSIIGDTESVRGFYQWGVQKKPRSVDVKPEEVAIGRIKKETRRMSSQPIWIQKILTWFLSPSMVDLILH